jgi:hypothetical protein
MQPSEIRAGATYLGGRQGKEIRSVVDPDTTDISLGRLWYPGQPIIAYLNERGARAILSLRSFARWAREEVRDAG